MQRDAVDAEANAALFELGRPVAGTHPRQIGKHQPFARQIFQCIQRLRDQMKNDWNTSRLPGESDGLVFPIHVLGLQAGDVD